MPDTNKSSFLAKYGMTSRKFESQFVAPAKQITEADSFMYGAGRTTISSLLGGGNNRRAARARQVIYEKWEGMESDAIVSSALKLIVTSALGGHETSGETVFIEHTPESKKDAKLAKIVDEITGDLSDLFNNVSFQMAYTGCTFGDAYARLYAEDKAGIVDMYVDELVRPQLVQPFERGNRTVGYQLYIGKEYLEKLDITQMARLKMPRTQWVPQFGVVEKALRVAITEDDINNLNIMPSMAGGSFLYNAEEAYDNLYASILGLVGQRWIDSIDEQMLQVNLESMTIEQQRRFLESVTNMLKSSKDRVESAVKKGMPIMERIRHIIPVFNEKQLTQMNSTGGTNGRANNITVEDVLFHARLLSGNIGVDLSMLGFADQMAGGLGEGGFFRVSAHVAEKARSIRSSLTGFFNNVCDIHTYKKYGFVFDPKNRPWILNYYGSISALEAEKQRTRTDSMNAGMMLVQAMQQMKDIGATEDIMTDFLTKTMMLDEDQAKLYATIVNAKDDDQGDDGDHGGGNRPFGR